MLSKAENIPIGTFSGLRTDANLSELTTRQKQIFSAIPEISRRQPRKRIPAFHAVEGVADVLISQLDIGFPWGISIEGYWSNRMVPESGRTEAAYICDNCAMLYESKELIQVRDIVGSEFCISSEKGERLSKVIRDALSRRKKIRLSFAGVNNISSAFLDEAIGNLYNGDFQEEDLKGINYGNISKEDLFLLSNVIEWAREGFRDSDE